MNNTSLYTRAVGNKSWLQPLIANIIKDFFDRKSPVLLEGWVYFNTSFRWQRKESVIIIIIINYILKHLNNKNNGNIISAHELMTEKNVNVQI